MMMMMMLLRFDIELWLVEIVFMTAVRGLKMGPQL